MPAKQCLHNIYMCPTDNTDKCVKKSQEIDSNI